MASVESELADDLVAARVRVEKSVGDAKAAREHRDELIRRADQTDLPRAEIARLAGVERQRVGQIVDGT